MRHFWVLAPFLCVVPMLPVAAQTPPETQAETPTDAESPAGLGDAAHAMELPLRSAERYAVSPQFIYPVGALRDGIEGRCVVSFTLDAAGVPQDIRPDCDHPIFNEPARAGVAATRLIVGGDVAPGNRFLLPVSFRVGM